MTSAKPSRERGERRKAMETDLEFIAAGHEVGVVNAVNAERQWRRPVPSCSRWLARGRERGERRKAWRPTSSTKNNLYYSMAISSRAAMNSGAPVCRQAGGIYSAASRPMASCGQIVACTLGVPGAKRTEVPRSCARQGSGLTG